MPGFLGALGMQAASQAVGGALGMVAGKANDKRQLKQNEKLLQQQMKFDQEMGRFNRDMDFDMLNKTSYPWQIQKMKEAGINPSLMLGMGGGGGSTTGSSGSPVSAEGAPKGGGEITSGMGLSTANMAAQIKVLEAQAENIKADTENKTGVERAEGETRILSLTQGIENAKAQETLTKIETDLKNITKEIQGKTVHEQQEYIAKQSELASEQLELMNRQNIINKATQNEKIGIVEAELTAAGLENDLKRQGLQVNKEQMAKWKAEIAQGWKNLDIQDKELARKQLETAIRKFEAEVKAAYPSIGEVIGNTANNILERAKEMIDGGKEYRPHKVK